MDVLPCHTASQYPVYDNVFVTDTKICTQDGFTAIIYDIQWGLKERGRDKETLSLLVTHTRWTVARLLELQNQSRMVEL